MRGGIRVPYPTVLLVVSACGPLGNAYQLYRLRAELQRDFSPAQVEVTLFDQSRLLIAFHRSDRADLAPPARIAFAESIATSAIGHYRGDRLAMIGVTFSVTNSVPAGHRRVLRPPMVFLPEYHPDGQVRLARLPTEVFDGRTTDPDSTRE
jgi:hypothetical protein